MAHADHLDQVAALDELKSMKSLIVGIVEALVDDPHSVDMVCEELDGATCFRLKVGPSDVGKLIGRQGRTARAIRTVLAGASMKAGHRYTLDILEKE